MALTEICSNSDEELNLDMALVSKLLAAVNESAEYDTRCFHGPPRCPRTD